MTHPLEQVMAAADGFLLIGDSAASRFPGYSFNAYTRASRRFYCLDMGGLTESRGPTKGERVYTSVDELPKEGRDDLALIWVHPHRAFEAVELAHAASCRRVWFSFRTGHRDAVARARELGMEVVEIGRCPVYYMDGAPPTCRAHILMTKLSGTWSKPPQLDPEAKRREIY